MTKEKITICIPTKNRSDFLSRLLNYFAATKYQHWIFIGDSSNDLHFDKTKKTINSLKDKLKVKQFKYPGLGDAEAMAQMNQFITTPFSAFLADDDFLCPRGIDRCIDFLESNPDYGAAHGLGIGTRIDRSGPYGNISYVHYSQQATFNASSGSQRLRDCFAEGTYPLIFSVHRTEDWQDMWQVFMSSAPWMHHDFIFNDLIPHSISSIRNKVKELNCLYMLRFGHEGIHRIKMHDWFSSPHWSTGFKNFEEQAIAKLIQQDGISQKEAEEVFKEAFQPFFERLSLQAHQSYKRRGISSLVKKIDRHLPGFKKACLRIMLHFQERKETNLLSSLLKPTSPYHEDFMPIYRAITSPPKSPPNIILN